MEPLDAIAVCASVVCAIGVLLLADYSGPEAIAARCISKRTARLLFGLAKAAVIMAAASLFLTLLLLAYLTLVDEPPPTHAQRVDAAVYGCALAVAFVLFDLVINAVHWGLLVPSVLEALFESPSAREELKRQRISDRALYDAAANGTLDDAPLAWLSVTAVHLAASVVPTVVRPAAGTRAPDADGNAQLYTTLLPLLALAASFAVVCVVYGLFVGALRRLVESMRARPQQFTSSRGAVVRRPAPTAQLLACLCKGFLGVRPIPAVFGASVARSFACLDAFITSILVLATFDHADAAVMSNWQLMFLGIPLSAALCVPVSLAMLHCSCADGEYAADDDPVGGQQQINGIDGNTMY